MFIIQIYGYFLFGQTGYGIRSCAAPLFTPKRQKKTNCRVEESANFVLNHNVNDQNESYHAQILDYDQFADAVQRHPNRTRHVRAECLDVNKFLTRANSIIYQKHIKMLTFLPSLCRCSNCGRIFIGLKTSGGFYYTEAKTDLCRRCRGKAKEKQAADNNQ